MAVMLATAVCAAHGADPSPTRQFSPSAAYQYVAETRAPVKREGAVKAGAIAWQCKATQCTVSGPWPSPDVATCKALAQVVGGVKRYGHATKSLSAAQLTECNAQKAGTALSPVAGIMPAAKAPAAIPASAPPLVLTPPTSGAASARPLPSLTKHSGPLQRPAPPSVPPTVVITPVRAIVTPIAPNRPLASAPAAGSGFAPPPAGLRAASAPTPSMSGARFALKTLSTGELTMTGLRFQAKTVSTGELSMTGLGFAPKMLTTGELAMTGLRFHAKTLSTSELTMTGLRFHSKHVNADALFMTGTGASQ
jgi:hypothetical protein